MKLIIVITYIIIILLAGYSIYVALNSEPQIAEDNLPRTQMNYLVKPFNAQINVTKAIEDMYES